MRSFFTSLSVSKRLALGFSSVLILSAIIIAISIVRLNVVAQSTSDMVVGPIKTERILGDWYRNVAAGVRRTLAIAKSSDPSLTPFFADDIVLSTKQSGDYQKTVEPLMETAQEKAVR